MKRYVVIYGAGNIGRGFAGQLLHESGYDIIFIDVNETLVENINIHKKYPIYIAGSDGYKCCIIDRISAVSGKDAKKAAAVIAESEFVVTSVGVNILPHIAGTIADGIKLRRNPLTIILCENKIDADTYFRGLVEEYTDTSKTDFVRTSVGCMVPPVSKKILGLHPLAISVEDYKTLYADVNGFKNGIPYIKHMITADNFQLYIEQKLYMHNMSHVATAYLGKRYRFIHEAIRDPEIKARVKGALAESVEAMKAEHRVDLKDYAAELLNRYDNRLLCDTTERVGRDTKRKLSYDERIIGAMRMCLKHGIDPTYIKKALVAGMKFEPNSDLGIYYTENGFKATLEEFCGISDPDMIQKIDRL